MSFELHSDLKRDGIPMGEFALCHVLLINDATYPWFVLVPKRNNVKDTINLTQKDHEQLWLESRIFSTAIMDIFDGQKLNVAALGNVTPQLHIHHIVRYDNDPAWPGPIWGKHPLKPYSDDATKNILRLLEQADIGGFSTL